MDEGSNEIIVGVKWLINQIAGMIHTRALIKNVKMEKMKMKAQEEEKGKMEEGRTSKEGRSGGGERTGEGRERI